MEPEAAPFWTPFNTLADEEREFYSKRTDDAVASAGPDAFLDYLFGVELFGKPGEVDSSLPVRVEPQEAAVPPSPWRMPALLSTTDIVPSPPSGPEIKLEIGDLPSKPCELETRLEIRDLPSKAMSCATCYR
jgi:hypothetical protein